MDRCAPPFFGAFDALRVDDGEAWAALSARAQARLGGKPVVDAFKRAVPRPQHGVVMNSTLGWQVLRQSAPLAAGRQHIQDPVQNRAHVDLSTPPPVLGRRDQRRHQSPFVVGQIARIAQPFALVEWSIGSRPHRAPPLADSVHTTESQPILSTQVLSGRTLRPAPTRMRFHVGADLRSALAQC